MRRTRRSRCVECALAKHRPNGGHDLGCGALGVGRHAAHVDLTENVALLVRACRATEQEVGVPQQWQFVRSDAKPGLQHPDPLILKPAAQQLESRIFRPAVQTRSRLRRRLVRGRFDVVGEIGKAKAAGAVGLKILKTLGLYLRDGGPAGKLVRVDDERFDPMWDACGRLGLPVAMHVGDPEAFFTPIDRFNERYEELGAHPDWSFYGKDFPSFKEILAARDRVFAKHPKTTFVALHVGHWAENLAAVGEMLDKFRNVNVEIAARIGELGRQPRTAARFFDRYQDRILFGTDAIPLGVETPQQVFGEDLYHIYYRFLETEDEYFDYAPARIPPQGRWKIYGVGLPDQILRKVYHQNAERVLGMKLV